MGDALRVVIADDDSDLLLLLGLQLSRVDGIEVVGEARDGQAVLQLCDEAHPDVLVLDLLMPVMSGVEALPKLRERFPALAIVACSAVAGQMVRELTDRLGVPLVLKSGRIEPILDAIRAAVDSKAA
ncbi:MAG: hypothetical protein AMXMBFR64_29870 [Myxococcales bacterium]